MNRVYQTSGEAVMIETRARIYQAAGETVTLESLPLPKPLVVIQAVNRASTY